MRSRPLPNRITARERFRKSGVLNQRVRPSRSVVNRTKVHDPMHPNATEANVTLLHAFIILGEFSPDASEEEFLS
jgi:hypothetical protein